MRKRGKPVWFHPKKYGWGWGRPATWQGWLVLAAYLVILPSGLLLVVPDRLASWAYWIIWIFGWTGALIAICYRTGPRPHWRWGRRTPPPHGWPKLCQECEYDLTANESGECPECGGAIPTEQIEQLRRVGDPARTRGGGRISAVDPGDRKTPGKPRASARAASDVRRGDA